MNTDKYISFYESNDDITSIGKKAFNLKKIPYILIPNYIVIKSELFLLWKNNQKEAINILEKIIPTINNYLTGNNFIIRSSALNETIHYRGIFESSSGNIQLNSIKSEIISIWEKNLPLIKTHNCVTFAIIIQEYINPILLGHLSNERRISRNFDDYYYEILSSDFTPKEENTIKANKIVASPINPICKNKNDIINFFRKLGGLVGNIRVHFEWVWDGSRIWILQKDIETAINNNDYPGKEWKYSENIINQNNTFHVLKNVYEIDNHWKKAYCVKIFKEVELPTGDVYIIEGESIVNIFNGEYDSLISDLKILLAHPIVIRIDIKTTIDKSILLPRTETVFKLENAIEFIKNNIITLHDNDIDLYNICFLLHRFIISKSCALAYSKPNIPRTRIDSTWGIVEGLYYHPHDSFEFNSSSKKEFKKIRCKTEYIDINNNGKWISKKCNSTLDWARSLTPEEVITISNFTQQLSSYLEKPVIVMYFVGVFQHTGYPNILPWYFTTEEIPESTELFSELIFSKKRITVENYDDFILFKDIVKQHNNKHNKITLHLKLSPDLFRDRNLLESLGTYAKENNIPIEIQGSILSHPYYILKNSGAVVKTKYIFSPDYSKQVFYKLVRDKIPVIIQSKGENVKAIKLSPSQTLEFIKQKLIEESYECFWANNNDDILEELADIYELIRGASSIFEINIDEIRDIADKKKEKRGGFDESLFLIETSERSLINTTISENNSFKFANSNNEYKKFNQKVVEIHNKSKLDKNNNLFVPYTPALDVSKRQEIISIDRDIDYIITYKETGINISQKKKTNKNPNQLDIFK